MIRVKAIREIKKRPYRGFYSKLGRNIIKEFQRGKHRNAEIELEYDRERELQSLYQAMKSLVRRSNPKLNIDVSIDRRERKLYLTKLD